MKKAIWIFVSALMGILYSCDSDTGSLGIELVPEADKVDISTQNFDVTSRSILCDSVLSRTKYCYLGNYTDTENGSVIHSDFMAQFLNLEGFEFPDVVNDEAAFVNFTLFYSTFTGDTLAPCRVSVYPLTKSLDNSKNYYTNVDPKDFYDSTAEPLATTTFTLSDRTLADSTRYDDDYANRNIKISVPAKVGSDIIKLYKSNPEYFKDAATFEKNVMKGFYFKFEKGDGVMVNIELAQLNIYFRYLVEDSNGVKDSVVTGYSSFASTSEVIQANTVTQDNVDAMLNDPDATYIKTPAGIFTELTLPINEIASRKDTINSAKLTMQAYSKASDYSLSAPTYLLLVRKKDMYSFFENNKLADEETSYISSYTSDKNCYTFNNISHLISYLRLERNKGVNSDPSWEQKNPDWNKVVLIPVDANYHTTSSYYSSSTTLVEVNNLLSLSSAKLKSKDVKLEVIFSKFNQ